MRIKGFNSSITDYYVYIAVSWLVLVLWLGIVIER